MTGAVDRLSEKSAILDVLARAAWALDEKRPAEFVEQFTDDALIERRTQDGSSERWSAAAGSLTDFPHAAREGVSIEELQTWTSDVVFSEADDSVVSSTSLRIGSAAGGLSNVILGDDRVHDTLVHTPEGWRISHRVIELFGAQDRVGTPPSWDGGTEAVTRDRVEIEALFADYAWALDMADMDRVLALFSDDAVMQDPYGRFAGSGADGVRRFFEGLFARPEFAGRIHWVSQLVLTPVGDDYRVDSYALVPAAFPNGAANLHLVAFYRDLVRREKGRWVFVERLVGARWPRDGESTTAQSAS